MNDSFPESFNANNKEKSLNNYKDLLSKMRERVDFLYKEYLKNIDHNNLKDYASGYTIDLNYEMEFKFKTEQCSRRLIFEAKNIKEKYNIDIEPPNFLEEINNR